MNVLDLTYQLGLWTKQHPDLMLYGGGGMLALMLGASLLGRKRRPSQITHGSARWASPKEIVSAGFTAPHGVVCGRLGTQLLCDDSETHVLLVAPSRSGKGTGVILPTLLGGWHHSALVYDPADGENADVSAGWRQSLGHRVEQFTPRRSPQVCINVLDLVRIRTPHEFDDAWAVSESLLAPAALMHDTPTAAHFRRLATALLTAGQLHMLYTEAAASLGKLWTLLTQRYGSLNDCLKAILSTAHTQYRKTSGHCGTRDGYQKCLGR